jgi:phosphoribosylformylglycinamidine cyclo-ligase
LTNLRRLNASVGFEVDAPLAVPGICRYVCDQGSIEPAQAYQVFNMGIGFVAVVPAGQAGPASELLDEFHAGTRVIGRVTDRAAVVSLPGPDVTL